MIHEEGLDRVYRRHGQMADATRRGVAALGMSVQCPSLSAFAMTLTAIALPDGTAPGDIRQAMRARGIETAGALGPYAATAFRIGHMGDIRLDDVERTLTALSDVVGQANSG
jgi:aspartate aminotransferase-like enzyme